MVWHTIRRDLWLTFGNVSEVASLPPAVKDVDCSAVSDGALHVGMVDGGGRLLHAFRSPNGSWNAPPTDVESRSGERGSFGKVSMTVEPFALT